MQALTFDNAFQRAILRLMMVDGAFCVRALQWLDASHFTVEPLGWMFRLIEDYFATYAAAPTDTVLRECVRRLATDKALRYSSEVELVISIGDVAEAGFIRAELSEFVKQAIFARAHQESADLFNRGKRTEAYDIMARAQERIQDVSFEEEDRIWLFDSFSDRNRERMREHIDIVSRCFTTGIPELDRLTDGGVHHGELWVVFAYAKRCKTTWLINQGFGATRVHRKKTVHFVLEGHGRQVASRYDACFSREHYQKVKAGQIDPALDAALRQEYETLRRMCVIRTINSWEINILDLEKELHYLKSQGFKPEMMIVDYMDLGRARGRVEGERDHQIGFARDLKRLVNNEEVACWSAWQAQRPAKNAHTKRHLLTSANVADAYAKVRIVDAYGSLNATDEEMEAGTMRLFWEGHRDAPVNQIWEITNDLSRMRMATSSRPYQAEVA